ncbi:MAG: ribose 5-phosphate isomerase B [Spirochaetaceae bacterium]|nr:MAG: ribose 5-phosphate isomerase B [Spirochaetaceae bacterium]
MGRVLIGNDHGAVELKQRIVRHLEKRGFTVVNRGVNSDDAVDYPDIAQDVCEEFLAARHAEEDSFDFAILACGTGIGVSISANKIHGIRCALPQNIFSARMAREHNDVNVLAFGGRVEYAEPVEAMLDAYIDSRPEGGRHANRVRKIMELEE